MNRPVAPPPDPVETALAPYANAERFTDAVLTCDLDWAPDYALAPLLERTARLGLPLTVFATHATPLLSPPPPHVEVALHPDFTRSHPDRWGERLAALRALHPAATGMRSHRNLFGANVSALARAAGLAWDASILLFNRPHCLAHRDGFGLLRFAYCWEDGIHLDRGLPLELSALRLDAPGMKILNLHPFLHFLNATDDAARRNIAARYAHLPDAPRDEVFPQVHRGRGIGTLIDELLEMLAATGIRCHRLGDLAARVPPG